MASAPMVEKNRVAPSGSALAIISAAMAPFAPGLFSTTMLRPSAALARSATSRATKSVVPPGAKATIIRIGRAAESSARGPVGSHASRATMIIRNAVVAHCQDVGASA